MSATVWTLDGNGDVLAVYTMSQQQMPDYMFIVLAFDAKNGRFAERHRSAKLDLLVHGDRDLFSGETHGLIE